MIKSCTTSTLLLLALAMSTPPALAAKDVKVGGVGIRKCAEWNSWKTEKNGEARAVAVEWTLGFIAGHNVYSRGDSTQSLVNPNAKTVASLLDTYCQKRADDRLFFGALDIVRSLGGARVDSSQTPARPPAGGRNTDKPEL